MCKIISAYNLPEPERHIVRTVQDQMKDYKCFYNDDLAYPYISEEDFKSNSSVGIWQALKWDDRFSWLSYPETCYVYYAGETQASGISKAVSFVFSFMVENNKSLNVTIQASLYTNDNRPTNDNLGRLLIEVIGKLNPYTNFYLLDEAPKCMRDKLEYLSDFKRAVYYGHDVVHYQKYLGWDTEFNVSDIENSIDEFPTKQCSLKVKDLIRQLQKCDPNADIILSNCKNFEQKNYCPIIIEALKIDHDKKCFPPLKQTPTSLPDANVIVLY